MAGASVLIVDDDRSIVRLCQRLLERASYEVFASTDPLEAIKVMESRKIDLLLSDIRMPVMDGFELIERGKALQPDLAVLVMTGFGTVDTAVQALYKGVDGLILKPFENTADLVQAVQRVLVDSRQKQDAARAQALRPLFDVSETLLSETSLENLEKLILNAITGTFHTECTGVLQPPTNKSDMKVIIGQGLADKRSQPGWPTLSRQFARSSSQVIVSVNGPGDVEMQSALRNAGFSAAMIAPIHRNDQKYIFFTCRKTDGQNFTETDLELFAILARQSVVALENARLYTDLKDYIRKVEESQRALVQAEKMAAVGRLMASLAHEINNPLQAVRNCLHLAMRDDIESSQKANYLNMTDTELDRLVNTVRHMLDFYRPGQVEKEYIDLGGVIERVFYLLKSQLANHNIETQVTLAENCPNVRGVRDQVQQVIFNLVINAMEALEGCSDKNIWLDAYPQSEDLVLTIEDSGPGIPDDMRDRLFEPFASTKPNGTGLGLAVSYGVVEAHGGTLTLQAGKHGKGACFEIRLPLEEGNSIQ